MSPRARKQTQTMTEIEPGTVAGAATLAPPSSSTGPSRLDRITRRAYEIYERRGGQHGHSVDDWLQAEREIDGEA